VRASAASASELVYSDSTVCDSPATARILLRGLVAGRPETLARSTSDKFPAVALSARYVAWLDLPPVINGNRLARAAAIVVRNLASGKTRRLQLPKQVNSFDPLGQGGIAVDDVGQVAAILPRATENYSCLGQKLLAVAGPRGQRLTVTRTPVAGSSLALAHGRLLVFLPGADPQGRGCPQAAGVGLIPLRGGSVETLASFPPTFATGGLAWNGRTAAWTQFGAQGTEIATRSIY
jgi:hypothetical protein